VRLLPEDSGVIEQLQEFPGDGHDGLVGRLAPGQPLVLLLPVRIGVHRNLGGLHQHPAQFPAPLPGDPPGAMRLAAVVNARPQPGISHQVLGRREARNETEEEMCQYV